MAYKQTDKYDGYRFDTRFLGGLYHDPDLPHQKTELKSEHPDDIDIFKWGDVKLMIEPPSTCYVYEEHIPAFMARIPNRRILTYARDLGIKPPRGTSFADNTARLPTFEWARTAVQEFVTKKSKAKEFFKIPEGMEMSTFHGLVITEKFAKENHFV